MNFKVKGFITQISEVTTLSNGAKKLTYRINNEEQYNNLWEFEVYKSAEHAAHADKFLEYNKVGDRVEVEFQVRPREYEGKIYTNLSHWKIEKMTGEENALQSAAAHVTDEDDDLPF